MWSYRIFSNDVHLGCFCNGYTFQSFPYYVTLWCSSVRQLQQTILPLKGFTYSHDCWPRGNRKFRSLLVLQCNCCSLICKVVNNGTTEENCIGTLFQSETSLNLFPRSLYKSGTSYMLHKSYAPIINKNGNKSVQDHNGQTTWSNYS